MFWKKTGFILLSVLVRIMFTRLYISEYIFKNTQNVYTVFWRYGELVLWGSIRSAFCLWSAGWVGSGRKFGGSGRVTENGPVDISKFMWIKQEQTEDLESNKEIT